MCLEENILSQICRALAVPCEPVGPAGDPLVMSSEQFVDERIPLLARALLRFGEQLLVRKLFVGHSPNYNGHNELS